MNAAAVGFELGLAGASGADASAEARHGRAVAGQTRQKIIQLRQFDLQFSFAGAGAAGKNIQDQLRAVQDLYVQLFFQIALLGGRKLAIEDHRGRVVQADLGFQILHFAGAYEGSGIGARTGLDLGFDNFSARRFGQRGELLERVFGADRRGSRRWLRGAGRQIQADENRDFLAVWQRIYAIPSR